jgi:hypothetical protein
LQNEYDPDRQQQIGKNNRSGEKVRANQGDNDRSEAERHREPEFPRKIEAQHSGYQGASDGYNFRHGAPLANSV